MSRCVAAVVQGRCRSALYRHSTRPRRCESIISTISRGKPKLRFRRRLRVPRFFRLSPDKKMQENELVGPCTVPPKGRKSVQRQRFRGLRPCCIPFVKNSGAFPTQGKHDTVLPYFGRAPRLYSTVVDEKKLTTPDSTIDGCICPVPCSRRGLKGQPPPPPPPTASTQQRASISLLVLVLVLFAGSCFVDAEPLYRRPQQEKEWG